MWQSVIGEQKNNELLCNSAAHTVAKFVLNSCNSYRFNKGELPPHIRVCL